MTNLLMTKNDVFVLTFAILNNSWLEAYTINYSRMANADDWIAMDVFNLQDLSYRGW